MKIVFLSQFCGVACLLVFVRFGCLAMSWALGPWPVGHLASWLLGVLGLCLIFFPAPSSIVPTFFLMTNSQFEYVKTFELPDVILPSCWIVVRIDGKGFHKYAIRYDVLSVLRWFYSVALFLWCNKTTSF